MSTNLEPQQNIYRTGWFNQRDGLWLVGGGLAGLVVALLWSAGASIALGVAFTLWIVGVGILAWTRFGPHQTITLYNEGLVHQAANKLLTTIEWTDITDLDDSDKQFIIRYGEDSELRLATGFRLQPELLNTIKENYLAALIPPVIQRLKEGEGVDFGPFHLTAHGLEARGRFFAHLAIDEIHCHENGLIALKVAGRWQMPAHTPVNNRHLLVAVHRHITAFEI